MLMINELIGFGAGGAPESVLLTPSGYVGDMTSGGGLAAAFDGNTNQAYTVCAVKAPNTSGYGNTAGATWAEAKTVTAVIAYGPNNDGFRGDGASAGVKLQGWNGSAWVDLWSGTHQSGVGAILTINSGIDISAAYSQHRLDFQGNGGTSSHVAEIKFYGY